MHPWEHIDRNTQREQAYKDIIQSLRDTRLPDDVKDLLKKGLEYEFQFRFPTAWFCYHLWYNNFMNICSRYHTEVVFETRECPMCLLMKELDKRAVDVGKLNESIESNKEERKELEADMERLREKLTQAEKDLELTRNGQLDGQRWFSVKGRSVCGEPDASFDFVVKTFDEVPTR